MTAPSLSGLLTATAMLSEVRLKPGIPVTEAPVAEALSAVYFLDLSERLAAIASPNSTPVSASPFALTVPPLMPTNAERLAAPIVSRSTVTSEADPASLTVSVFFSIARFPLTAKNPPAVILRFPLARSRFPSTPGMLRVMEVAGPVLTTSGAASQSTTG